jgi:Large polyvalent protein associated domain 29
MYTTVAEKAKAIKQELKAKYPSHKFSVRSENYSMGSSFYVSWIDGPTEAEVKEIANKYKDVRHDENGDILSGGNCFSHLKRGYSPEIFQAEVDRISKLYKITNWRGEAVEKIITYISSDDGSMQMADNYSIDGKDCETVRSIMGETIDKTSYYKSATDKTPISGDNITVTENDEKNGVEIKFDSKPSREILDDLKANGFKYSRKQNIWYAKRNLRTLDFAALIAENRGAAAPQEEPQSNDFSYLLGTPAKVAEPTPAPTPEPEEPRPLLALAPAAVAVAPIPAVAEIVDDPALSVEQFRTAASSGKVISLFAFSQAINRENAPAPAAVTVATAPAPAPAAIETPTPIAAITQVIDDPNLSVDEYRAAATSGKQISLYGFATAIRRENTPLKQTELLAASAPPKPANKELMLGDHLPGGWICVRSSRGD